MGEVFLPVLVVDDDDDIRHVVIDALAVDGLEARGAANADAALAAIAADGLPLVVVLDLNLPKVDGETFLRRMAELSLSPENFPVVIFSADPRAPAFGTSPYVVSVLPKPVKLAQLLFVVRHAARAK